MKLTVLKWIGDSLVPVLGKTVELCFRVVLSLLPLGIYMILLQMRSKASSVTSISVFTKENSIFQHVFPGYMLVSVDPDSLQKTITKLNSDFQLWINNNKYTLSFLFMAIIVGLMILSYIKGGI